MTIVTIPPFRSAHELRIESLERQCLLPIEWEPPPPPDLWDINSGYLERIAREEAEEKAARAAEKKRKWELCTKEHGMTRRNAQQIHHLGGSVGGNYSLMCTVCGTVHQ